MLSRVAKKILNKRGNHIFEKLENEFTIDYAVNLKISSIVIRIESEDPVFSKFICLRYNEFKCNDLPEYLVRFYKYKKNVNQHSFADTEEFIHRTLNFDEGFLYKQYRYRNELNILLPLNYKDWEIDNILKLYFSAISLDHNILLFHASCIIKKNSANLFFGKSGAGKSTISRLSGLPILHDDIIAITIFENGEFCLQTIPFKVNFEKKSFVGKIEACYRIIQSDKTHLAEINKQQQLMHLIFAVWNFDTFKIKEGNGKKEVVEFCSAILDRVSVKNLYFTKSNDFLKII